MSVLRSSRFFWAILLLFVLESAWIAISAAYPMVFDENTHLGIIKLYAHSWSPIFLHQPADAGFAGALTRDPSYLYHYLMSFPYRLVAHFTSSLMSQVIALRFINILLFGGSLVLFRRLLLKARVSDALTHTVLLFFILIPVVPLLAAQINYDNLVMVIVALSLLWTITISERLVSAKKLPAGLILGLLTLCLFGSLVQFEFLPVFVAIAAWLSWQIWRQVQSGQLKWRTSLRSSWHTSNWQRKLIIGIPLAIAVGLFVQMYGTNLVVYHSLAPQCNQVLTNQECAQNGTWERSQMALAHKSHVDTNPVRFSAGWLYRLAISLFYTSSGGASPKAYYLSINPLPTIFATALLGFGAGVVLVLVYWRQILRTHPQVKLFLFVAGLYVGALWLTNYHDYVWLGIKIAINGRYLLPIAPLGLLILGLGYQRWLANRPNLKVVVLIPVLILFLQGGGTLTYLVYSNSAWYWKKPVIINLNRDAQRIVKPLVILKSPVPVINGL